MISKLIICLFSLFLVSSTHGQFSFNCTKNITIPCNQSCISLTTKIPVINAYSNQYTVNKTDCFRPNISPAIPGISTNLSIDDRYTPVIPLPFLFSVYGIYYLNLIVNTNGALSFDFVNSDQTAPCVIQGQDGSLPSIDYDRAVIMGAFHDIDISQSQSPSRKIKYDVVGIAPHRKWVLSFYKVPCYDCQDKINNTYQISLYEGLSIVEVHVFEREVCAFWNSGAAMIGMQNYERNSGIMAPGRSAFTSPRWQGLQMNEAWRFVPAGGPSLLKKVELYKSTGEFVATGDTVNSNTGTYSVSINNICPDSAFVQYIVKSAYYNIEYPFQFPASDSLIYAFDTINVSRSPVFKVQSACPGQTGSIIVQSPVGANYSYSIDNGVFQSSTTFNAVPIGTHVITVKDNTSGCLYDDTIIQVNTGYSVNTQFKYPKAIYCNNESLTQYPVINGVAGGRFATNRSGLSINANTGAIDVATSDTGNYTVTYRITGNDSCVNPLAYTEVRIVDRTQFVWTGEVTNNWENAFNWACDILPDSTSNVVIYSGTVVINSNITINKLTIMPGASLTISPDFNLTILNP